MESQFSVFVNETTVLYDSEGPDQSGDWFQVIIINKLLPIELERSRFDKKSNVASSFRDRATAEIVAERWSKFLGAEPPGFRSWKSQA